MQRRKIRNVQGQSIVDKFIHGHLVKKEGDYTKMFEKIEEMNVKGLSFKEADHILTELIAKRILEDYIPRHLNTLKDFINEIRERLNVLLTQVQEIPTESEKEINKPLRRKIALPSIEDEKLKNEMTLLRTEVYRLQNLNSKLIEEESKYLISRKELEEKILQLEKRASAFQGPPDLVQLITTYHKKIQKHKDNAAKYKAMLKSYKKERTLLPQSAIQILKQFSLMVDNISILIVKKIEEYSIQIKYKSTDNINDVETDENIIKIFETLKNFVERINQQMNSTIREVKNNMQGLFDIQKSVNYNAKEISVLQNQIALLKGENKELDNKCSSQQDLISSMIADRKKDREYYSEKNMDSLKIEVEELKSKLKFSKEQTSDSIRRHSELQQTIFSLQREANLSREKIRKIDTESFKFEKEKRELTAQIVALHQDLIDYEESKKINLDKEILRAVQQKSTVQSFQKERDLNDELLSENMLCQFENKMIMEKFLEYKLKFMSHHNLVNIQYNDSVKRLKEKLNKKYSKIFIKKLEVDEEVTQLKRKVESLEEELSRFTGTQSITDDRYSHIIEHRKQLENIVKDGILLLNNSISQRPELVTRTYFFKQSVNLTEFFSGLTKDFRFLKIDHTLLNKEELRALYSIVFYYCSITGSRMVLWFGNEICRQLGVKDFVSVTGRLQRDSAFWDTQAQWIISSAKEETLIRFKKFNHLDFIDYVRHNLYRIIGCSNFAHQRIYFA
jgi:hypothetical protein